MIEGGCRNGEVITFFASLSVHTAGGLLSELSITVIGSFAPITAFHPDTAASIASLYSASGAIITVGSL